MMVREDDEATVPFVPDGIGGWRKMTAAEVLDIESYEPFEVNGYTSWPPAYVKKGASADVYEEHREKLRRERDGT